MVYVGDFYTTYLCMIKKYMRALTRKKKRMTLSTRLRLNPALCKVAPMSKSALGQWPQQPELIQWHEETRKVFLLPSGSRECQPTHGPVTPSFKINLSAPTDRQLRLIHLLSACRGGTAVRFPAKPTAPICIIWSWRLKGCFAPISTVNDRLHSPARRLCSNSNWTEWSTI